MWQLIVGAIAGGVAGGVNAYLTSKDLRHAYSNYADAIKSAAKKYSGANAENQILEAGDQEGRFEASAFANNNKSLRGNQALSNLANGQEALDFYDSGNQLGRSLKTDELNSKYNADTAAAKLAFEQAQKASGMRNQMAQEGMNTAGGLVDLYKNIQSDERIKDKLPEASVEDALRQIDSIEYKYKPETGLDQDKHVGVTAQSLEGTAFDDVVSENNKGIKQLDKQKLLESVMAGIAALQKEIDELENK